MSDDQDEVPPDAAPPQDPAPKPAAKEDKIDLLDMIIHIEDEIGDVDTWERVLRSEGKGLYPRMARRRAILRRVAATLELVKLHESEFRALVIKARKEAQRLAAAATTQKSTARSSAKSTSENDPSESTEP